MISIIIPVHNQLKHLNKCLISIKERSRLSHEVIISDSNSDSPANENYYSEAKRQGLIGKVVYEYRTGGFSRAVNNGMMAISDDTEYVVWLNSDTIICTDSWLESLTQPFYSHDNVVASGPISNSASYQTFINTSEKYCSVIGSDLFSFLPSYPQTWLPNGFCVMIKREVAEKTGHLDEANFPHYGSEDDYFLRMEGDKRIASDVFVYHHGKQSYKDNRSKLVSDAVKKLHEKYPYLDNHVMHTEISLRAERDRVLNHLIKNKEV